MHDYKAFLASLNDLSTPEKLRSVIREYCKYWGLGEYQGKINHIISDESLSASEIIWILEELADENYHFIEILLLSPIFYMWWVYSRNTETKTCVADVPLEIVSDI